MKQETLIEAAKRVAYPNGEERNGVSEIIYRVFKEGAEWQRNHVWHKTDEIPKLKKDILVHFESGNMVTMYVDKEILDKFKKYYVDYWAYIDDLMPTSFDEILEANKDVLQRLRDKYDEINMCNCGYCSVDKFR